MVGTNGLQGVVLAGQDGNSQAVVNAGLQGTAGVVNQQYTNTVNQSLQAPQQMVMNNAIPMANQVVQPAQEVVSNTPLAYQPTIDQFGNIA